MALPLSPLLKTEPGTIGRRLTVFMALGFAGLVVAILAAALVNSRQQQHTLAVAHTYQVENTILDVRRLIEQGETTRRGFLLAPDNSAFLSAYREVDQALPSRLAKLRQLTSDNPRQQRNLDALKRQLDALTTRRDASVQLIGAGQVDRAIALFREELEAKQMRGVRARFDAMNAEEHRLLDIRAADLKGSVWLFYVGLAVATGLLVVVALTSLATILAYTRDLNRSQEALRQLNESLEDQVVTRTADLTRANDEIQRFAYIVSHDLRSPLVNVMGFTAELEEATGRLTALVDRAEAQAPDLLGPEDAPAARQDLPEAIGFIRTSTQKMDRLINAILQLSRQGRRVLVPEPVDVAAMVATIAASMAHRLDDEDATVTVAPPLPAIVSDRLAIEQVLSNLIENAVKYRKPSAPVTITVSGERRGTRAFIHVADNGRGIDPRDHARVFDLFRRSGSQDRPGEGIGLATVRALVYRLGGTIDVASALGEGATFTLSLPITLELGEKPQ